MLDAFLPLIPHRLSAQDGTTSPKAFSRRRKLPLPLLFRLLRSLTVSGKRHGGDSKSGAFFRQARRSGLWPAAEAVHRSAVTQARAQRPWTAFEPLHREAVCLTDALWPTAAEDPWQGLAGFALEGSIDQLPAAAALRQAFDPDKGLDPPGTGHDPPCVVSTVSAVFRRLPIARTVRPIAAAHERDAGKALLPASPRGGIVLFDRGSPSDDLIAYLNRHYAGYRLCRGPAHSTFPAVEAFVRSGQTEAMLPLPFSNAQTFPRRAVRLTSPDGTVAVLLTNLMDPTRFSAEAMMALSCRRWGVETPYRAEKTSMASDTFHSQTENGLRPELFAILIMAVLARRLMRLTTAPEHPARAEPQFKHAILPLATEAYLLTPQCPELALMLFRELLNEIARVRDY